MKLRLHANTLRLRLNRADVSVLASAGRIEDSIVFGPGSRFAYSLEIDSESRHIRAVPGPAFIRILVPAVAASDWVSTDRVGLESEPSAGPQILIEKDFQCLHGSEGDFDPSAYPNPLASSQD